MTEKQIYNKLQDLVNLDPLKLTLKRKVEGRTIKFIVEYQEEKLTGLRVLGIVENQNFLKQNAELGDVCYAGDVNTGDMQLWIFNGTKWEQINFMTLEEKTEFFLKVEKEEIL